MPFTVPPDGFLAWGSRPKGSRILLYAVALVHGAGYLVGHGSKVPKRIERLADQRRSEQARSLTPSFWGALRRFRRFVVRSPRRKCTELFLWGVLQLDHNQRSLSLAELAEDPGAGFVLQEGLMVPGRDEDSSALPMESPEFGVVFQQSAPVS